MMKTLWPVVVLGLSSLWLNVASAHGDAKAKHGGVVAMSSGLGFELVDLVVAGDKLEAKGIKLAKGAKEVTALVTPAAKAITVRFTVE